MGPKGNQSFFPPKHGLVFFAPSLQALCRHPPFYYQPVTPQHPARGPSQVCPPAAQEFTSGG